MVLESVEKLKSVFWKFCWMKRKWRFSSKTLIFPTGQSLSGTLMSYLLAAMRACWPGLLGEETHSYPVDYPVHYCPNHAFDMSLVGRSVVASVGSFGCRRCALITSTSSWTIVEKWGELQVLVSEDFSAVITVTDVICSWYTLIDGPHISLHCLPS